MTRYAIGVGSNEGDRLAHLRAACNALTGHGTAVDVSPLYESEPVGGPEQDPFLNAVVVLESEDRPEEMLDFLQSIEDGRGRERKVRWGPRTLDLDIVATDGPPIKSGRLTIPHPRAIEREFVLRPLADVWPEAPLGEYSASEGLSALSDQGVDFLASDWYPTSRRSVGTALVIGQFVLFLVVAVALAYDGSLPEGDATALRIVGAALAMLGMIIAFIASRRLGPAMTAHPMPKAPGSLVLSGPYRYVRHPIYGGVTLVMVGTALFLDSILGTIAGLSLLPYFWLKSGYEERQLRMHYAGYRAYRAVVHRRLLPFVI